MVSHIWITAQMVKIWPVVPQISQLGFGMSKKVKRLEFCWGIKIPCFQFVIGSMVNFWQVGL